MNKLEKTNYTINYSESLEILIPEIIDYLEKSIKKYQSIFQIKELNNIVLNYFDNKEEFRNYIYELRGEKESLPEYAAGTFDNDMINAYLNPKVIKGTQLYNSYITMAPHELFHILFKNNVWGKNNQKRILWYDEGMAQFFSGENDHLNNESDFKIFYFNVKKETKIFPNLNNLVHGDSFNNENYNGYNLSYLTVKYLYDTLNHDDFISLLNDIDKIESIGNEILINTFKYFDNKYCIEIASNLQHF